MDGNQFISCSKGPEKRIYDTSVLSFTITFKEALARERTFVQCVT